MEQEVKYGLPHTIQLDRPLVTRNLAGDIANEIAEVTFKNDYNIGMGGHLPQDIKQHTFEHYYPIIAKMTGLLLEDVKKMKQCDYNKCLEVFNYFFSDGLEIGDSD